jgi:hypothetical protein
VSEGRGRGEKGKGGEGESAVDVLPAGGGEEWERNVNYYKRKALLEA